MGCHICNLWVPESGCKHFLPDSETVLKLNGWSVSKNKRGKFVVKKACIIRTFESLAKAVSILINK